MQNDNINFEIRHYDANLQKFEDVKEKVYYFKSIFNVFQDIVRLFSI